MVDKKVIDTQDSGAIEYDFTVRVPDSLPRIYFKSVAITIKRDRSARIIFSDSHTVELHIEKGKVKAMSDMLNPVAEIITDIEGLEGLRNSITERIEKYNKQKGEIDG